LAPIPASSVAGWTSTASVARSSASCRRASSFQRPRPRWTPLQLDPVDPPGTAFAYGAVARLAAGVTVADAERDFTSVLPRAPELVPKFVSGITTQQIMDQVHPKPSLAPLREDITGGIAATLWMVAAAAALVLLVACANVANLTLVRADAHQREIAVREALGARRGRVMLYFFAESLVVAAAATALGLAGAASAVRFLVAAGPAGIPRLNEVVIDVRTVLFSVAVAGGTALVVCRFPRSHARQSRASRRRPEQHRRTDAAPRAKRSGCRADRAGARRLAASGLLVRTSARLHAVHPGFAPEQVSTFWISRLPPGTGDAAVVGFYSRLIERVAAMPGVEIVGLTSRVPLESHGVDPNPLYPEDDPSYATKLPPLEIFTAINGDYFRAMGIPILAGRTFDRLEAQRDGDAIVSRRTAELFWKDATGVAALGKRFRPLPTSRWYSVIGVVGDTRDTALSDPPAQVVYLPETLAAEGAYAQAKRTMALVVRTAGEGTQIATAVPQVVRELDPALPTFDVRPLTAVVSAATARLTFIIFILGGAASVTLILGAVGLYGVLAYIVTLRKRELGIRMALGASPRAVGAEMARYGIAVSIVGIAMGLASFTLAARLLRGLLFGVASSDPLTLGGSAVILLSIAIVASWVPARRAARVDPHALRAE
jgi:predicted permease